MTSWSSERNLSLLKVRRNCLLSIWLIVKQGCGLDKKQMKCFESQSDWKYPQRRFQDHSFRFGCLPGPGACFSKVPKLFGPISGATTAFISSQRQGSKSSNFAILLVFLIFKTCKKISFSKQADCSLTTSSSGPKSSRDFRETGPCWARTWNFNCTKKETTAKKARKTVSCDDFQEVCPKRRLYFHKTVA